MPSPSDSAPSKKHAIGSEHTSESDAFSGGISIWAKAPSHCGGGNPTRCWISASAGCVLSVEGHTSFAPGARVRAVVRFEDGKETVEGTVLRGNEREAVFQLTEGFSLERIRREERRLIRAAGSSSSAKPFPPSS
jgi:hypothetical protein